MGGAVTGAVKQHWHEEICARFDDYGSPEPDELEMLEQDARLAAERYEQALKRRHNQGNKHEPV